MHGHATARRDGLSLLELLIVITIIAALATYAMIRLSVAVDSAAEKACNHNVTQINSASERYAVLNDAFPTDLTDLETNDYFPEGVPICPVSGTAYSLNSTTHRVDGHAGGSHP